MNTMIENIDLTPLRDHCKQLENLWYVEPHYFPNPLVTLFALFGEANCHFSEFDGIHILRIEQNDMTYSGRVPTNEDRREWLARAALNAMPLSRVTDIMCEQLIYKDPTLACEPYMLPTPRTHTSVSRSGHKRKADRDDRCALLVELAEALCCATHEIRLENSYSQYRKQRFWKCVVWYGERRFEPHVHCKTIPTAEQHALLNALCMVKQ